jgi:Purple acid Phosphatase, N-terminal domain/Calcineurin-like phosphoesterase
MTPEQAKRLSLAEQHEWYRRATSRRAVLRGGAVGAGALLAGPALLGSAAAAAATTSSSSATSRQAAPSLLTKADYPNGAVVPAIGRHVAFGADPTTQVSVSWQVPAPVSNPFLRVGPSPSNLSEQIPAEVRTLVTPRTDVTSVDSVPPSAGPTITQYYVHAKVDHLFPGGTYYYSIGHLGLDPADVIDVGTFRTAPAQPRPFTFTAYGDQGVTYDAVANNTLIRAQSPAFHLHAGDCSYAESGGSGLITDPFDPRVWDSFFNEIQQTAGQLPWQIAVGNHEMEAWYSPDGYGGQYKRWEFPGESAANRTPTTYYSFVYGNVGVISLDANDVSYELPANLGYTDGAQTAWLQSTLASLRENPAVDFIVVYFHHCTYCTCTAHGSEGGVRQYWAPLFDQYQVDLVINGHNHIYERTDPIINGSPTGETPIGSTIYPAKQGTTYVVAGAGGESLYEFPVPDSYEGHIHNVPSISTYVNEANGTTVNQTVTWSRVRYTGYCLLVVESQPATTRGGSSTLNVRGLNENGTELDQFTLVR